MPNSICDWVPVLLLREWILAVAAFCLTGAPVLGAEGNDRVDVEFFETRIRPVLVSRCYECHSQSADEPAGGLLLDSRESIRQGGDSGPAVVPGNKGGSLLLQAIRYESFEMPPDRKLPEDVLADFETWIERGAADPRDGENSGETDPYANRGTAEHWSFQPIVKPDIPGVAQTDWPLTNIDYFALARMEQANVAPIIDADRMTWLRRAYLDLIGLPPSKEDVEAFLNDTGPDAYRTVVDRLLGSPEFGVRWGRHWLDIVRYAESTGFERNFTLPHAWRYRDYVVESFNADKPYDRFVAEQIAGDLLAEGSESQPGEHTIATGMLALGPKNLLQGNKDLFALDMADDQINVTSRAILGLTVACARCHDHKFDPIPTEDYYALAGIFLSTETLYGTNPGKGGGSNRYPSDLLPVGPKADERHADYEAYRKRYDKQVLDVGNAEQRLKKIRDQKKDLEDAKSEEEIAAEVKVARLKQELDELEAQAPPPPHYSMGVRERNDPEDTAVRLSGVPGKHSEVVPRGFLSVLDHIEPDNHIPDGSSGRLQLARWLTSEENPLTARVMVNRIWHHLFGRGIVETVDNFGFNGTRPTHPELLDYLAVRFQQHGWSVKAMIREIILSRLYRLDSRYDAHNAAIDGENLLLWRMSPRRADAEVIRDSMLQASGELDCGAPEFGSLVTVLGDGCLVRQVDPDELRKDLPHRTTYLPMARHFAPDIHQVFDGPAASLVVGRRSVTNVPAQSLFLLNNGFVARRSEAMAERLLAELNAGEGDVRDGVERAYWLVLSRSPTSVEADHAIQFLRETMEPTEENDPGLQPSAWTAFCQALFLSAEFRTVY